jgi:hypothetical protein
VELQHEGAKAVQKRLRGLSRDEILAYWAAAGDALREWQQEARTESHVRRAWDAECDPEAEARAVASLERWERRTEELFSARLAAVREDRSEYDAGDPEA